MIEIGADILDVIYAGMKEIHFWIMLGVSICGFVAMWKWPDYLGWLLLPCFFGTIIGGCGGWDKSSENEKKEEAERKMLMEEDAYQKGKNIIRDLALPDLIPCVTCKRKISKRADTCVGCGEKVSHSLKYYGTEKGMIELGLRGQVIMDAGISPKQFPDTAPSVPSISDDFPGLIRGDDSDWIKLEEDLRKSLNR